MFFTSWAMFWNTRRVYFFSLIYKILRAYVGLFFSNISESAVFDWFFIPFQLYLFIKDLIFDILCWSILISWWFNAAVAAYWKHLLSSFFRFIVAFFFFIQAGGSIYDSLPPPPAPAFKIYFVTFIIQQLNWIKNKIISSHWCF